MAQSTNPPPPLSKEQAQQALQEGLTEFEKPENKSRMEEAIQKAQGSPQGLMQYVLPLAIQIKGDILEKYGFTKDQMGAMQLITAIQMHATSDPQMNEQLQTLKGKVFPVMGGSGGPSA
eukprot:gb/GECG01005024.1/.p1 GENE.gb/GECG01005024.1/~~gb/GECG01005024.1/.p1  ORF type:complete len:119 (+),score=23.91 gb/GECG01005024.1/:1-357(+)